VGNVARCPSPHAPSLALAEMHHPLEQFAARYTVALRITPGKLRGG
jgi:hypothetical protein